MRYQRAQVPLKIDGIEAARDFFAGCLAESDARDPILWVAHVDEESRCLHVSCHEGAEEEAIPIQTIIADAAVHHSAGIVLAHNRLGGGWRPSDSDRSLTRRLAMAAEALDCTILDHLVFEGAQCTSMRRLGYL